MEVLAAVILAITVLVLNVHNRNIDSPVPVWVSNVFLKKRSKVMEAHVNAINPWREITSKLNDTAFCLTFSFVLVTTIVFNVLLVVA